MDVASRTGGVEPSEIPKEPAVSGLLFGSILGIRFLRIGTPSGHVHCQVEDHDYSVIGRSKAVHTHLFDYDDSDRGEA